MADISETDLATLLAHPDTSDCLTEAIHRARGAESYRCAFQVNPYDYIQRHSAPSSFNDENEYNQAMVAACHENAIDVVALTDHFRVDTSKSLKEALISEGIIVFPGFEANSSEGIHLLCLFSPESKWSELNSHVGACGVVDLTVESPQAEKTAEEIAKTVSERGGLTIAAHVCSASGLLTTLSGQARARVWRSKHILAAAVAGKPAEVPHDKRGIILNKDAATKRDRPMAIINANDVSSPDNFADNSASTLIKMSDVTIEGLRQAFLDAESRIRLNSDETQTAHTEIIAMSWDGGLFDGQCIRLNEGLNVLIGGRGSGKSTVIESLRYAFDIEPRGPDSHQAHNSIMKNVIKSGAEISVLIHSPKPSPQCYLIKRIYGKTPRVFNQSGELVSDLHPQDIAGDIEIYGQHEISELTRQPDEIAEILRRFVSNDGDENTNAINEIEEKLEMSSSSILSAIESIDTLDASISILPQLRENLRRYKSTGLDEKLKTKTAIDQESLVFDQLNEIFDELDDRADALCEEELYEGILPEGYKEDLPNPNVMEELDEIQDRIISASERAKGYLKAVANQSRNQVSDINKLWQEKRSEVEKEYNKILRELNKEGVDGSAYISVRDQISKIAPKEKRRETLLTELSDIRENRSKLIAKYESIIATDFRSLQRAAKKVGTRLSGKVRVDVHQGRDLTSLEGVIRSHVTGQISQAITKLSELDAINLSRLADTVRSGASALEDRFGFSKAASEKIAEGGEPLALDIEQHRFPPEAILSLNVGDGEVENWKTIDQLSTGQKATVVLLLLLLESEAPVVIDQPEDDLDNRFIVGSVISAIRHEKHGRQFLFSSHNANIPVLGDAEQIVGLTPIVDSGVESVEVCPELCGSIDAPKVKELIKELLEGGQAAFNYRREKYGF